MSNTVISHCYAPAPKYPGKSRIGVISAKLQSEGGWVCVKGVGGVQDVNL